MNNNSDFNQLDHLLALPSRIADRGFSERIQTEVGKLNRTRRYLFLITRLCWLVLVLLVASPQATYADLTTLAASLDIGSIVTYVTNQLQFLSRPAEQPPYTSLAAAFLSIAAVVSLVIRA